MTTEPPDIREASFVDSVKQDIEEFAKEFVGSQFTTFKSNKIINDAVWGTQRFEKHELSIISLPIIQRLRQIRQMGFVNYVYPSAIHTRFEHTLGTTILAGKLFTYAKKESEKFLDENDLIHIRIAALLHDIGHCMFSHTSEEVYGHLLSKMIDDDLPNADPKPHEYFAYLLINTEAFRKFFSFLSLTYRMTVDHKRIANYIIGATDSEAERYKVSFVNGAFDADKLDYIYRDSKFSGIPLMLDLDRLMHEIAISDYSEIEEDTIVKDMTIGLSGVSSLEQIVFNKMLLFSTIYHHQKVKACDCMFKGIFEYLYENKKCLNFRKRQLYFNKPTDFLWFTDTEFMSAALQTEDEEIHRMIHNILYRRPLKRALVISRKTIEEDGDLMALMATKANRAERDQSRRELSRKIWEDAGRPCSKHDIWVDIPMPPSFKESDTTYVRTDRTNPNTGLRALTDFFPTTQWTDQYNTHKLKGHVFAPDDCLDIIAISAKKILEKELKISFKTEAFRFCKVQQQ
jgi:HD superfamily phosphohydrolase